MSTPESKPGFLSAGINALSPWGSRTATPKPPPAAAGQATEDDRTRDKAGGMGMGMGMGTQRGGDHTVSSMHRLSPRKYPPDCPPLEVRWFHAVDIPKRKPFATATSHAPDKAPPRPKKWIPFSAGDSRAIETEFQRVADEEEAAEQRPGNLSPALDKTMSAAQDESRSRSTSTSTSTTVMVNEDYLFDVDIEKRELAPAYWLGPVYEVKRGTWFTSDGEPCEESFAVQLEEGYLKVKPWRFAKPAEKRSASQTRSRPTSWNVKAGDDHRKILGQATGGSTSNPVTPQSSIDDLKSAAQKQRSADNSTAESSDSQPDEAPRTYRLFGSHMNSVVTYQDETTAWMLTDDFLSRMGSTLYQRFAGGAHYAGVKYTRCYVDPATKKAAKTGKDGKDKKASDKPSASPLAYGEDPGKSPRVAASDTPSESENEQDQSASQARRRTLERHMSSLMLQEDSEALQEEEIRKRDEQEMREDYKDQSKAEQGREIEHLLLVTHGIGQRLGIRLESVNFIHDVNSMRKSLKGVYSNSPDLQALNSEVDQEVKNSRIQALPICWRHLLDFPKHSLRHNRKEHDLGDLDHDDEEYPNLEDITVEGVPAVRNLLTDLALDILLYQSPAYKNHITRIVLQECNRIYRLFKERNPGFNGKVSLVGHSLGSAIMFDILCQQKKASSPSAPAPKSHRTTDENIQLDFEVEDFYALGSPIGLFQMLKGRTIAARSSNPSFIPPKTPQSPLDDPFSPLAQAERAFEVTTSSPACRQLFNIFHPTDPISYRLEPLISPAMSSLKPQPLPYTKKGIFSGTGAQGITGITSRVGQGVTDFWTSVSSGIASGLLNRSLGLTGSDATKMSTDMTAIHAARSSRPLGIPDLKPSPLANATTNTIPSIAAPAPAPAPAPNNERQKRLGDEASAGDALTKGEDGEHPPTLIDSEIETLYAGFQKRRKSSGVASEGGATLTAEWRELEEKSRRLRKEEAKVRGLNGNGRVDYSIQEGAFDISLLASIASHLSYWADEDVAHFMISQLLSRQRVYRGSPEASMVQGAKGEEGEEGR